MNGYAPMSRMAHLLALTPEEKARFTKEGCIGLQPETPKKPVSEKVRAAALARGEKLRNKPTRSPMKLKLLKLTVGESTVFNEPGSWSGGRGTVSALSRSTGWKFSCKKQLDGSLKVTRKA